jgi:Zinc carboxypeptidase
MEEVEEKIIEYQKIVPELIDEHLIIGETVMGKPIYAFCIGACSDSTAPAMLLTGLHHAREPMGMLAIFDFVDALIAKWRANDPLVMHLTQKRRVIAVPVVSVDSYSLNLERFDTDKLHRKNAQFGCNNGVSVDQGVDLNRNYDFAFDIDNEGSSPMPCAEDYRGPSPFSEPETLAIKNLVASFPNISSALNWHSYGRTVNVPYAVKSIARPPLPDYNNLLFVAANLAKVSGYTYGHPWENTLYSVNGETSDWLYAAHGVISYSPEVGPDFSPTGSFVAGLYPSEDQFASILAETSAISNSLLSMSGDNVVLHGLTAIDSSSSSIQVTGSLMNLGVRPSNSHIVVDVVDLGSSPGILDAITSNFKLEKADLNFQIPREELLLEGPPFQTSVIDSFLPFHSTISSVGVIPKVSRQSFVFSHKKARRRIRSLALARSTEYPLFFLSLQISNSQSIFNLLYDPSLKGQVSAPPCLLVALMSDLTFACVHPQTADGNSCLEKMLDVSNESNSSLVKFYTCVSALPVSNNILPIATGDIVQNIGIFLLSNTIGFAVSVSIAKKINIF